MFGLVRGKVFIRLKWIELPVGQVACPLRAQSGLFKLSGFLVAGVKNSNLFFEKKIYPVSIKPSLLFTLWYSSFSALRSDLQAASSALKQGPKGTQT